MGSSCTVPWTILASPSRIRARLLIAAHPHMGGVPSEYLGLYTTSDFIDGDYEQRGVCTVVRKLVSSGGGHDDHTSALIEDRLSLGRSV
jgi:hypothetical protein